MKKLLNKISNIFKKIPAFFKKISPKCKKIDNAFFSFLKKYMWIIVMFLALFFSTLAKTYAFSFLSGDYNGFLLKWMRQYKILGIHDGFGASLGDYTPFYNYFLCIFGVVLPEEGFVYAIKIFNIFFEASFATAVFFIIQKCFNRLNYSSLAFSISLIIPSIIINGAFWGQCDIIFSSFVVWSFYFVISKKYNFAMIFFSIAFSIKLQAIFFLPFLFLLVLKREIKIWQLLYIPLIYITIALPAIICGRPFVDIITVYFKQAGEYNTRISLSAPSIYSYFDNAMTSTLGNVPVIIFFVVTLAYIFYLFYKDFEFNNENLVTITLVSCLFSPFFLPYMHERYFFIADIFAVLYVLIKKKGFFICLLINFASIACTSYWLFSGIGNSNMFTHFNVIRVCSTFNLIAVTLLIIELIKMPVRKPDSQINNS